MAMDGSQMGTEVANAIMNSAAPPEVKAECIKLWQKICTAIVNHITTNAEVPAGIAVSTPVGPGSTSAPGSVT